MNKKRLIILILVIIAVWYFGFRNRSGVEQEQPGQPEQLQQQEQSLSPQPSPTEEGEGVNGAEQQEAVEAGKALVHYFTNSGLENCSMTTITLEQEIDPAHGHPTAGALVALTNPLSAEDAENYGTALLPGTRLMSVRLSGDEVATADFNSLLNRDLGECGKEQRRAQIERTLQEFSQVKEVVITVNGEKWE